MRAAESMKHFDSPGGETEAEKMAPYKVMVDDNFHYMEEDERSEHGTFPTAAEALEACRRLVDEALLAQYTDGEKADQLFERYKSFGDDLFVVAFGGAPKAEFLAWTCARQRAEELTAPGEEGLQRRQGVLARSQAASKR
jgi:hypothetical protein